MRIQHTPPKKRERPPVRTAFLVMLLLVGLWGSQQPLPERFRPAFDWLQQAVEASTDLTGLVRTAGEAVSGKIPVVSVFRAVLSGERGTEITWQNSPHWQAEVMAWQTQEEPLRFLPQALPIEPPDWLL